MLGAAVGAAAALAGLEVDVETELGGYHHLAADGLERLAEQLFVGEGAIGFGGIEMGNAAVMGGANQLDHLALVGCRTIGRAHAHAAEADGGDFEVVVAEFAFLHGDFSVYIFR